MQSTWRFKEPFGIQFKLLVTFFLLATFVVVLVTIWSNISLRAAGTQDQKKIFVITEGESTYSFATRLKEQDLIRSSLAFRLYIKFSGIDRRIQAGSFSLSPVWTSQQIALNLTEGRLDKWLTLVEGLRKEEVAEKLATEFDIDKKSFLAAASEGYLFPDTYLVPVSTTEDKILTILQNNFAKKFTPALVAQAKKRGLSQKEVLIVASIIERETRNEEEMPVIADILLKRWREGMRLAADATVQYALGYADEEKTWWRKELLDADLKVDNPYNTRLKIGLPPGPISSPGLAAIQAVITPAKTEYYFYLHDAKGQIHYAKTYEEHLQNVQKYL